MRTTLDIDDDVLLAAKELAAVEKKSAGKALSDLARAGLQRPLAKTPVVRNGFELLAGKRNIVTVGQVDRLIEEDTGENEGSV